jgi:hypothetical protein
MHEIISKASLYVDSSELDESTVELDRDAWVSSLQLTVVSKRCHKNRIGGSVSQPTISFY